MSEKEEYHRRQIEKEGQRQKRKAGRVRNRIFDPNFIIQFLLVLCTAGLIFVGFLQKWTLDKTDDTIRSGERAFVFVKQEGSMWTAAKKNGEEINRNYIVAWENNGNSQTRDMKVTLWCPRPNVFDQIDPISSGAKPEFSEVGRLLGPKQSIWGGVCNYSAAELENIRANKLPWFIAAEANYYDIFGKWHLTEYCIRLLNIDGDFKNVNATPTNDVGGCDLHNCSDEECPDYKKKRAALPEPP